MTYPAAGPSDDVELVDVVSLDKRNQSVNPFFGDYDDEDGEGFFPFSFGPFNVDFSSWLSGFEGKVLSI